jgi:hypothetical protein
MTPYQKSKAVAVGQVFVLMVFAGCLIGLGIVAACDAVVRKVAR